MTQHAKKDRRLTMDEREPSDCTKQTEFDTFIPQGLPKGRFWSGINYRDETDAVTHEPVGRGISAGFHMMDNDYDGEDL